MSRGSNVRKVDLRANELNVDLLQRYFRRIIYLEILEPRFASMDEAVIHFYLLKDGRMQEYEICYADSVEFYRGFIGMMDRYIFADMFRNYRYRTKDYSYRVLIHKGAVLDANGDLGGFVFQNNKDSFLVSPYRREVFERLRDDLLGSVDGVAQLVRVGCLLKNKKFRKIHNEYFGKIGVAALKDGATIKQRYADSVANNNVITDMELFKEYVDMVNAIPMSEFTEQSVVSQLAKNRCDTKQMLTENYSNFLFAEEDEIEFAAMILDLFLHRSGSRFSLYDWARCISYVRSLNGETVLRESESEQELRRVLQRYRANYVLEKVSLPKLVHFIYDFFDYNNLSRNIGAFYPRLNELLGEDIREKYLHLETINVSLKSFQDARKPEEYFLEPKLVNFSTAADKEIQKQILSGNYNHVFAAYYLSNYMQVEDYKKYNDVLPVVVSIIQNLRIENEDDYGLFWVASDLLNEFLKLIPDEAEDLQVEIESLVYKLFWPHVGDVWPVEHRNELSFNDELRLQVFHEGLSWIMSLKNEKLFDRDLRKYLASKIDVDAFDIADPVDKRRYCMSFAKRKERNLAAFVGGHSDEEIWWRAAIYCDDISDGEIAKKLIGVESPLFDNVNAQKKVLEQLLLKVRNQKDAKALFSFLLGHFDDFYAFLKRLAGSGGISEELLRALTAACESVTSEAERDYIVELSRKMGTKMPEESFNEAAKATLEIAEARIRLVKFQNKGVTPELIKSLV